MNFRKNSLGKNKYKKPDFNKKKVQIFLKKRFLNEDYLFPLLANLAKEEEG